MPVLSQIEILREVPVKIDRNGSWIVLGYSDFASRIIGQLTQSQVRRVIVMDDSDCKESYEECIIRPDRLSRVRSSSYILQYGQKRAFWDETLLGLALATRLTEYPEQEEEEYQTYLGSQHFDHDRCYEDTVLISEDIK